jgi:hypothetical protein
MTYRLKYDTFETIQKIKSLCLEYNVEEIDFLPFISKLLPLLDELDGVR